MAKLKITRHAVASTAFCLFNLPAFGVEVTEPVGTQHGYPSWRSSAGQKLADGEFRQWIEKDNLHVVITYKFQDGRFFEETTLLRQKPELVQEKWSWNELKN